MQISLAGDVPCAGGKTGLLWTLTPTHMAMSGALIYSSWAQKPFCCRKCRRGPVAARTHPKGHTHWSGRTALSFRVSFPWMPWHSSGGMSTACGGRSFPLQRLRPPTSPFPLSPKNKRDLPLCSWSCTAPRWSHRVDGASPQREHHHQGCSSCLEKWWEWGKSSEEGGKEGMQQTGNAVLVTPPQKPSFTVI